VKIISPIAKRGKMKFVQYEFNFRETNMRIGKNRIHVRLLKDEEQKVGGLIVPTNKRREVVKAEILKVGLLTKEESSFMEIDKGDIILIPYRCGATLDDTGSHEEMIIEARHIYAVMD
jgi:co-chaperonin GroES (HSP10)